jgi:hypothetical protein
MSSEPSEPARILFSADAHMRRRMETYDGKRGYWRILKRAASRPELDPTAHDDEEGAQLYQVNGL